VGWWGVGGLARPPGDSPSAGGQRWVSEEAEAAAAEAAAAAAEIADTEAEAVSSRAVWGLLRALEGEEALGEVDSGKVGSDCAGPSSGPRSLLPCQASRCFRCRGGRRCQTAVRSWSRGLVTQW
jgi:hypothetical protein